MEERLAWIKRQPAAWTHWAPVTSGLQAHKLLNRRYPQALCHLTETTPQRADYADRVLRKPWWQPSRWSRSSIRIGQAPAGSADLLWAGLLYTSDAADEQRGVDLAGSRIYHTKLYIHSS